jgi:hypothetical protein
MLSPQFVWLVQPSSASAMSGEAQSARIAMVSKIGFFRASSRAVCEADFAFIVVVRWVPLGLLNLRTNDKLLVENFLRYAKRLIPIRKI